MQQQQQQYYYFSSNNPNPINNSNSNNNSIFYPENDITNINSFSKLDDDNNNIDYDEDNDDDDPACSSNNFLHFNNFPNSPQMLESYESVYLQFYDLFQQQPQSENTPNNMVITSTDLNHENDAAPDAKKTKGRCSKKDRHSKIITASGPRDRRMRLSLDVARRFFQLQDILGYDKASRTVDWLLNSSRDAIKELLKRDGRSRSTSSSITESIYDQDQVVSSEKKKTKTKTKTKTKKNNNNKLVAGVRGAVGKESRQKARERARERTSQKKRLQMMTKNSTSTTSATTFNEERIDDDDHNVTATRGDENNTNTLLFSTAGLAMGPWNINTSTSVFGDNATWNF